jgi:hypothetical protein
MYIVAAGKGHYINDYINDAALPAGERVFAAGLVHSCLHPLSLPPSSHVDWRSPPSFRPFGSFEAEAF